MSDNLAIGQRWKEKDGGQIDTIIGLTSTTVEYAYHDQAFDHTSRSTFDRGMYAAWAKAWAELISEGTPAKRPVAPADPIPHIAVPPFPPDIDELLAELEAALPAKSKYLADKFAERVATWAMAQGAAAMIGGGK